MNFTPTMAYPAGPVLTGAEGELVSVRVSIEPRHLEELLECLSELPFPVNPQIIHGRPTLVEFPAYESRVHEVQEKLHRGGFEPGAISVARMIEQIAATGV